MKKAMLSQPMAGKSEAEIIATREQVIRVFKERGYEVVNTLFTDEWYSDKAMEERGVVNIPLCFLAKSLENMSKCHAAYFCRGWKQARGCQIEHAAAVWIILYAVGTRSASWWWSISTLRIWCWWTSWRTPNAEMAGSGVQVAKEAPNVKVKAEELRRCQGYLSLL